MRNVLLIALAAIMVGFPLVSKAQTANIVYVDLQRVMVESDTGKEAKQTLTQEAERRKKSLDGKQGELQKMKDAFERQGATITPEARAEKEKQYQAKLKDYQRLVNDYQTELQQKDQEWTQRILKGIEDVVRGMGEREKYTLILEKSQAGILFGSPAVDITSKVISQYNEAAKRKPAAPAKK